MEESGWHWPLKAKANHIGSIFTPFKRENIHHLAVPPYRKNGFGFGLQALKKRLCLFVSLLFSINKE